MFKPSFFLAAALLGGPILAQQRPYAPFVEKCFTAERSRQLKVALHPDLWVLYDIPKAELYMAWQGGTAGGSLVEAKYFYGDKYNHFPHWFQAKGPVYFKTAVGETFSPWTKPSDIDAYYGAWPKQPRDFRNWSVTVGGQEAFTKVRNRGYLVKGTAFTLNFGLRLKDGGEIAVTETPDHSASGGKVNLVRRLDVRGIPAGAAVKLALPAGGNWSVTGTGSLQGGALVQSVDGETTLTGSW